MRKIAIFLVLCATVFSGVVHAQEGRQHFEKAMALAESQMWSAAAVEFRKAREAITTPQDPLIVRCDYMVAICAAEAGEGNARILLEDFLSHYPHTIYHNEVDFALSGEKYKAGEWEAALKGYLAVDPFSLPASKQDEYHFKLGHCYFNQTNDDAAYRCLRQVDPTSPYGPSATYYLAYIDYVKGNYGAAKQGFQSLVDNSMYEPIVPYYLLQIEFLEGNYRYVVDHGDALLKSATRERAAEIARLMAESWHHYQGYAKALDYITLYRSLGGEMGREENYLEGYSYYMTGDCRLAVASLSAACGPEDALSQNASYHLADCYLKLGEKKLAMQSFSIAAAGNYDDSVREDALFNYGKLQYELGGGVFNEAINVLNRYIKEYPSSSRINQAREYLIAAYYNSRNYEAAYQAILLIPNPDNNIKAALQKTTYFRALEYFNAGDLGEAQRLLDISARNRFSLKYNALTSFWQGEVAYCRGDYKAAIPLYRDYIGLAPKTEPEYAAAHYDLGYCYFNTKSWTESAEWFGRYLALPSIEVDRKADTYNRLGDIRYGEHTFWPALEEYDKAIKLGTEQAYYAQWRRAVLLGLVDRVPGKIDALKTIVSAGKGDYVDEALYELGRTYMNQQNFTEAASALSKYVEQYPAGASRVDALSDLALVYQNLGKSDRALEYYKQVVSTSPGTSQAKDAVMGIRSIYVDKNDVDGYFAYAAQAGVEGDISAMQRDSLSFASAERLYLAGTNPKGAVTALQTYLKNYPKGTYRTVALYDLGDCALRSGDRAASLAAYKELAGMNYNDYTVRALEQLARMQEEDKDYPGALASYRSLSRSATVPATVNRGLEGYLQMARKVPGTNLDAVAAEILESPYADAALQRSANFIKAQSLTAAGNTAQALAIYEKLSHEVQSPEGAESAFRVIEAKAAAGNGEQAKKLVFALSSKNSPQTYWVARAFLVLGDIYAAEGDAFQARATYQSIVDGYSPATDGIVEQAQESIKKLK